MVFGQVAGAHDAAVQVDVFRMSGIAGLDEFLSDDAPLASIQLASIPGSTVTFSGIRIDAADKINL